MIGLDITPVMETFTRGNSGVDTNVPIVQGIYQGFALKSQ